MNLESLFIRGAAATFGLALVGSVAGADAVGWPPPGQYTIDSEAVMTMSAGAQRITRTEGTTGKQTTTVQANGSPPQTIVANTGRPNTWCVHANTGGPPAGMPTCQTTGATAAAAGSSFSANCPSMTLDSQFRKIDARTWEHTFKAQVSGAGTPAPGAREAMIRNAPGLTAEQRQQALSAIGNATSARDAAMAQARANLQQEIATASPEDAALARQQLAAMERMAGGANVGAAAPIQTTSVKERWTLTGRPCDAGQ